MALYRIPISPIANQTMSVTLAGQTIRLDINQKSTGLYANIWLNGTMVVAGAICQDRNWIARYRYLGLPGDFVFLDQQATTDPTYDGLGSRYLLFYRDYVA